MPVKIFDTTLRDGEQTNHVSFSPDEKLIIAQNLLSVMKFDMVEIGSCRVSEKEKQSISKISSWAKNAGFIDNISVLSFCDNDKSINWLMQTECRNINLLTKGSRRHCEIQLKKTIKEHIADIEKTLNCASKNGISASVYLEDWSNGMIQDEGYVMEISEFLVKNSVKTLILCDTLGILSPWQTYDMVSKMKDKFPNSNLDFHCHNDYGFGTANAIYATKAGISRIHGTINGLGERAGNVNLSEFIVCLKDHLGIDIGVSEHDIYPISSIVERFSGKKLAHNAPIVGKDVFTQTAGIHADGDNKGDLYISKLNSKRFARNTQYSLGKMSGKGSLEINLSQLGITLTDEQKSQVLSHIISMGDEKKSITQDDLPFLIADILGTDIVKNFEVLECIITSSTTLLPVANIKIRYINQEFCANSSGNGGYDAFMNALHLISQKAGFKIPQLQDFEVSIPKGGQTNALVETVIHWENSIRTSGVSSDQIMASIRATEKAINLVN
ncbi:LeuA family protein [Candidatus Deianiraea vastatrix]|uniref:Citramalate synthase n=1 Tax=Candidatus Deianiraea vastatrix TaxID=2163644 RepID=A0A5B8XD34_9RICK|nr:alpha-isopropylmalate synthase regulatory domain-containing protein [Candidatus Deianiraea vastatrix]QED23160.1 Putative citramalate synthase [Candidatus Deianiraea vastatrix]